MRSYKFAVPLSLYLVINGWMYTKYPIEHLIISLVLTLPLLFISVRGLRVQDDQEAPAEAVPEEIVSNPVPDILSESLVPYISGLMLCFIFVICIYKFTHPGMFFIMPTIAGWTWMQGLTLIVVGLGMAASGLAVWSGHVIARGGGKEQLRRTLGYHLFKMEFEPNTRLILYFVSLFIVWAAGYGVTAAFFASKRSWDGLVIVAGRCVLPMCLALVGAMLRLPAAPFLIVGLLSSGALFAYNTSPIEGAIFTGVQIIIFSIYTVIIENKTRVIRKQAIINNKSDNVQENGDISE